MKRILVLSLALAMLAGLYACAPGASPEKTAAQGAQTASANDILSQAVGGEITVSCYDTMLYQAFLEEAAQLFEAKYPGVKVKVETFSAMPEIKTSEQNGNRVSMIQMQDDPQGRADYINKVNTSLMGGTGADILAMDILPIHKYAASGQLENLNAYMDGDPDFNRADFRENILDAVKYNGGTWFMPLDYSFNFYAYDSTLLSADKAASFGTGSAFATEQLIDLAKDGFDAQSSPKLFNMPSYVQSISAGMFGQLLKEKYASFVDVQNKKANFADGSFAALLKAVKEYAERGYIPEGMTGQKDAEAMIGKGAQPPADRYSFKEKNCFMLTQQYNKNSGRRMMIMSSGALSGIDEDDEVAGIQANADGSVPFTFQQAYGINANSKNKQTAWAFIKFLLGEEMQLSTKLTPTALPMRNAVRAKKAELILSGAFMGRGEELDDAQKEVLRQYSEAVEQLSDQINTYVFEDTVVNDMIAAEAQYFFDGSKSAEDVANVLQNKVNLYLSE